MAVTINGTTGIDKVQDDSVDIADLSATGTASSSTYLRGDNTWATVTSGATSIDGLSDGNTTGTDNVGLGSNVWGSGSYSGTYNTAVGKAAMYETTSGQRNVAVGRESLYNNTSGSYNVALGMNGLQANTTANANVAVGYDALKTNTTGGNNVAVGSYALQVSTTAGDNVAIGDSAMIANTTGNNNVAVGSQALDANTTGLENVAIGRLAMTNNTTASGNVAIGHETLKANTTGANNTAIGMKALLDNSTGYENVAVGQGAGRSTTTGYSLTFVGRNAGEFHTTGTNCMALGFNAATSSGGANNEITLGNGNIASLRCNDTSLSGLSDQRDKANVQDLPSSYGLSLINALRPVTFNWDRREWYDNNTPDGSKIELDYDKEKGNSGLRQGFLAQEVKTAIDGKKALVDSGMVYEANPDRLEFAPAQLITNLVKAIQELSAKNDALEARITTLEG